MGHWLLAFVSAYGAVFLLELPDKTTALTLVLSNRFRGKAVLLGAGIAFALQAVIAVALGSAITLLPERVVAAAIAVLFGVGAFLLWRESRESDTDEADGAGPAKRDAIPFLRAAMISFGTLFLTEWGDASQVTAIGVAARYASPVAVGIGTFLALMSVTVLALVVGRKLRAKVPAHLIQRGAAAVFAVFALLALWQAIF
ncbi:TMEM165/GDT1 family protein [Actinophytocola algeriensis]|jgi:putative Ca2+/H+ antiporter (TMEM165/GDT1 family)|uniref:GDT1 family protein n=1 Tax=Actinophytocola algeriensis TaxID=1768010 RepID=A0A7W7Q4U3_9PSEU|nr:TMEM165/GDT1 family protein [Actinophytocola algeriensis]MBB4906858.1 putative Ca2+/H+ antiporter (TMEM165/GDT1 family) [Actinophytocola algeriensis]MBE1478339.1 putative Ca2+/H+ antiporter (TMEM165/GDT1 family) [Actinophytocola algeriensis]